MESELITNMTGVRFRRFEPDTALMYAAKDYNNAIRNIKGVDINYEATPGKVRSQYQLREKERYRNQQELYRKINAASHFMTDEEIIVQLTQEGGMGEDTALQVMAGFFAPAIPTDDDVVDMYTKMYSEDRPDLGSFEVSRKDLTDDLFAMYSDMVHTSLATFDTEDMSYEEAKQAEPGIRLLKFDGGAVDIPNAPRYPDERIDKVTGLPYSNQARRAFSKGGKVLKALAPHLKKLFKSADEEAIEKVSKSLAVDPLTEQELGQKVTIAFMNSNKSIPESRLAKNGTKDFGNYHELVPLESEEGKQLLAEFPDLEIAPGATHVQVENIVQQAKETSPIERKATAFNTQQLIEYYNTTATNTPIYAKKTTAADALGR